MNAVQIEILKEKVLNFVKAQKGFDNNDNKRIDLIQEEGNYVVVIYGENLKRCITGTGISVDLTYQDFLRSWRDLNGFAWLESRKSTIHN